jgi:hypothetical protein
MDLRAGLDTVKKRKNLSLPEFESRSENSQPEQFEDLSKPNSNVNLGSYQRLVLT